MSFVCVLLVTFCVLREVVECLLFVSCVCVCCLLVVVWLLCAGCWRVFVVCWCCRVLVLLCGVWVGGRLVVCCGRGVRSLIDLHGPREWTIIGSEQRGIRPRAYPMRGEEAMFELCDITSATALERYLSACGVGLGDWLLELCERAGGVSPSRIPGWLIAPGDVVDVMAGDYARRYAIVDGAIVDQWAGLLDVGRVVEWFTDPYGPHGFRGRDFVCTCACEGLESGLCEACVDYGEGVLGVDVDAWVDARDRAAQFWEVCRSEWCVGVVA